MGEITVPNVIPGLSDSPGAIDSLGPDLGQDNYSIYNQELGFSEEDLKGLKNIGVIWWSSNWLNSLKHVSKLAIVEDKPILLDYWTSSLDKEVIIGVRESEEKLLVKSEDEYTSPISKIYKVGTEYIIMTENSIYIVDVEIPTKRISS